MEESGRVDLGYGGADREFAKSLLLAACDPNYAFKE